MAETPFEFPDEVVAVVGSRGFKGETDYYIDLALRGAKGLVSGGAATVDRRSEDIAGERGLTVVSYRPKDTGSYYVVERWLNGARFDVVQNPKTGKAWTFQAFAKAAKQRNWWIVADGKRGVHALWDGMSSGTAHSIAAATRYRRPLHIWMEGDS